MSFNPRISAYGWTIARTSTSIFVQVYFLLCYRPVLANASTSSKAKPKMKSVFFIFLLLYQFTDFIP